MDISPESIVQYSGYMLFFSILRVWPVRSSAVLANIGICICTRIRRVKHNRWRILFTEICSPLSFTSAYIIVDNRASSPLDSRYRSHPNHRELWFTSLYFKRYICDARLGLGLVVQHNHLVCNYWRSNVRHFFFVCSFIFEKRSAIPLMMSILILAVAMTSPNLMLFALCSFIFCRRSYLLLNSRSNRKFNQNCRNTLGFYNFSNPLPPDSGYNRWSGLLCSTYIHILTADV